MAEFRRWSESVSSEMRGALSLEVDEEAPVSEEATGDPPTLRDMSLHPALREGGEWS